MSELTLTLLRLGYLALVWVFVLSVVGVLRSDVYGTRISRRETFNIPGTRSRGDMARGAPRTLVVTEGSLQGTTITLTQSPILIGRGPECTLVLDDDYASTRHCRIAPLEDGTWTVEDLGSTNGTFLNRARVKAPSPVEPGEPIRIGRTVLELRR